MNQRTNLFSQGQPEGFHRRCQIISLSINEQLRVSLDGWTFFSLFRMPSADRRSTSLDVYVIGTRQLEDPNGIRSCFERREQEALE